MNPELKAKWLTALRSGNFAQTKGYLKKDDGFCCLGVLCVAADYEFNAEPNESGVYELEVDTPDGTEIANERLPATLVAEARLPEDDPVILLDNEDKEKYKIRSHDPSLTGLNDIYGLNFAQIADVIEKYL